MVAIPPHDVLEPSWRSLLVLGLVIIPGPPLLLWAIGHPTSVVGATVAVIGLGLTRRALEACRGRLAQAGCVSVRVVGSWYVTVSDSKPRVEASSRPCC